MISFTVNMIDSLIDCAEMARRLYQKRKSPLDYDSLSGLVFEMSGALARFTAGLERIVLRGDRIQTNRLVIILPVSR